ncbi:MAG: SusC/RagA family TonB-linked outer membrane protein [Saprospiraceae bacterium]|nr:MAG: SusC/RagA family TonB-linked outer membrane protein [Saprospiraceae bacterium]
MMKSLCTIIAILAMTLSLSAQTSITGTVTDDAGTPLIGASILVKGTADGTITDFDGNFKLEVAEGYKTLSISYTGYKSKEVEITGSGSMNIILEEGVFLDEAVVTALGISREKKSLGYATQKVEGENLSIQKSDNFVNSLSGLASGVQVKRTTNMGGSTNVIIRGSTSLQGDNQALFVIDGVPINNTNTNSRSQEQAGSGYDYGNAASDINPDDIASVNILKGAAATALYGSRAANGVVMITTKTGSSKKKGIGVTFNSSVTAGFVDKSTFPKYQEQYGAGYGHYYDGPEGYWLLGDPDGDGVEDLIVPLSEDGSYGAPYDPNLLVYHWDAFDPESDNYLKKKPWVLAENGPIEFFETPVTYVNTLSFDQGLENGSYRFSYTNYHHDGLQPNSSLDRNNFSLKAQFDLTDRLTASGFGNYINTEGLGRNPTGYGDNIMGNFRQWWQTNVDVKEQEAAYFKLRRNLTWNYADPADLNPIYWDNPYWTRFENYESDSRSRFIGYFTLNYKLTDWLSIFGRVSADTYTELQEERKAIGSVPGRFGIGTDRIDGSIGRLDVGSGYSRRDLTNTEYNYDLMLNFDKNISDKVNIAGVIGTNVRRNKFNSVFAATNGGLNVPRLYSLQNTVSGLPNPIERYERIGVNGVYASASVGYDGFLYLEASMRRDQSSTLPEENNTYYYPAVATSFVFSRFVQNDWISFGKIRANYAEVGNSATFNRIVDNYNVNTAFNSASSSVANTKKNPNLKPERTKSIEAGLEMSFLNNRLGFDLAFYKTNSVDQILPVRVTEATGFLYKVLNAGEIENKGVELSLFGSPIKTNNFSWDVNLNWTRNRNQVVSLVEGLDNLQLGSLQGGITLNASIGQPYGVIFGTDYTYINGQPVVDAASGQFIKTSTSDNMIGDPNPDWIAGLNNRFSYKNWSLSFLIDMQQGGEIFSLDMYYGLATGMYEETVYTNDLGNPVRNTLDEGGGFINEGVNPDGTPNQTRIRADRYGAFGYTRGLPDKEFVYDAGYIKLRQLAVTYSLPQSVINKLPVTGISLSLVGSNLWIISKDLPHADPESGLGAGNLQGYSTGSLPSLKEIGFNLKVQF